MMDHIKLTAEKLSVEDICSLVADDSCGAISLFVGTTRNNFEGKKVVKLEYEAYEPMAVKALNSICEETREKWPKVHKIAVFHRLGPVPCGEASVVLAISSEHRKDSIEAVDFFIDRLKASVAIWKKEVYEGDEGTWKENRECPEEPTRPLVDKTDMNKNLIQINVSTEELQRRINNFMVKKREQVNISNIHDFIARGASEIEDTFTCARVRTKFAKRNDSKGHLKIWKAHNEWGPQLARPGCPTTESDFREGLPSALSERMSAAESFLGLGQLAPVPGDIYQRLKKIEDRILMLETISPEYAQFWKGHKPVSEKEELYADIAFTAEDIARKIEQMERA